MVSIVFRHFSNFTSRKICGVFVSSFGDFLLFFHPSQMGIFFPVFCEYCFAFMGFRKVDVAKIYGASVVSPETSLFCHIFFFSLLPWKIFAGHVRVYWFNPHCVTRSHDKLSKSIVQLSRPVLFPLPLPQSKRFQFWTMITIYKLMETHSKRAERTDAVI